MRRTRASNFRHKITIQKNTAVVGTTGEPVKGWAFYSSEWASVEPLQGRELFAAQQFQSESTVKIRMRHHAKLDAVDVRDYQITFNSKTYDINNVLNQFEANREMVFMCSIENE